MILKYKKNYHLDKLAKLLDADFSSKTPLLAYLNPDGVSRSWILISMICTPYILWLLFKLRKYGWLISFTIFVLVPLSLNYTIVVNQNASIFMGAITSLNWIVFLFILRSSHKVWKEPIFRNSPRSDFE